MLIKDSNLWSLKDLTVTRDEITDAVHSMNTTLLSKICIIEEFDEIISNIMFGIIHKDYLKYWNIHNVFLNYIWYNSRRIYSSRHMIGWHNNEINIALYDINLSNILKSVKAVGLNRLDAGFYEYMCNHFDNKKHLNILSDCFKNRETFTSAAKKYGLIFSANVHNEYLCTDYQPEGFKTTIKVYNKYKSCKLYDNIIVICKK